MPDLVLLAAVAAVVVLLAVYLNVSPRGRPVAFANPREEKLAALAARQLRCSPAEALPAVRRELGISPDQPDETLVKRAVYHHRRSEPDRACGAWRDRAPG
jgi:hypothetical protein